MFRKFKFRNNTISGKHKSNSFLADSTTHGDCPASSSAATSMNKSLPSLNNLHLDNQHHEDEATALSHTVNGHQADDDDKRKIDHSVHSRSEHGSGDDYLDDDASVMEGTVHLLVHLPGDKLVELDVDARTPMMDLLIHVTTCNGIQPGGLCLKAAVDKRPGCYLHYKPSTPVGKLACQQFYVVRKSELRGGPNKQMPRKTAALPFEPTVRISIDLPQNQKTFLRISPAATLREILLKVCHQQQFCHLPSNCTNEQLILSSYTLRLVKHRDSALDLNTALREIGFVDFVLIPTKSELRKSSPDVINLYSQMVFEEKQNEIKGRGLFGLFRKKNKKEARKSLDASIVNVSHNLVSNHMYQAESTDVCESEQAPTNGHQPKIVSKSQSVDESMSLCDQSVVNHLSNGVSVTPLSNKKRLAPKPPVVATVSTSLSAGDKLQDADNEQSPALANNIIFRSKPTLPLSSYAKDVIDQPCAANATTHNDSDGSSGYHETASCHRVAAKVGHHRDDQTPSPDDNDTAYRSSASGGAGDGARSTANSDSSAASCRRSAAATRQSHRGELQNLDCVPNMNLNSSNKRKSRAPPPPPVRHSSSEKRETVILTHSIERDICAGEKRENNESCQKFYPQSKIMEQNQQTHAEVTYEAETTAENINVTIESSAENDAIHSACPHSGDFSNVTTSSRRSSSKPTDLDTLHHENFRNTASVDFSFGTHNDDVFDNEFEAARVDTVSQNRNSITFSPVEQNVEILRKFGDGLNETVDILAQPPVKLPETREIAVSLPETREIDVPPSETHEVDASFREIREVDGSKSKQPSAVDRAPTFHASIQRLNHTTTVESVSPKTPRYSIIQFKDPKRDLYPVMKIKSFEDEYFDKIKSAADQDQNRNNPHFVDTKPLPNDPTTPKRCIKSLSHAEKNTSQDINNNGCATGKISDHEKFIGCKVEDDGCQLIQEYNKLQELFKTWRQNRDHNEQLFKRGAKLNYYEISAFRKLQDELLRQHQLVQKLYVDQENLISETKKSGAHDSANVGDNLSSISENLRKFDQKSVILPYKSPTPIFPTKDRKIDGKTIKYTPEAVLSSEKPVKIIEKSTNFSEKSIKIEQPVERCYKVNTLPRNASAVRKGGPKPPVPPPLLNLIGFNLKSVPGKLTNSSNFDPDSKQLVKHSQSVPDGKTTDDAGCADELMRAIRDFGGPGGLKKTKGAGNHRLIIN